MDMIQTRRFVMKKSNIEKATMAQAFVDWVTDRKEYTSAEFLQHMGIAFDAEDADSYRGVVYEYNRKNKDNIALLGWSPKYAGKGRRPAKLWGFINALVSSNNSIDEAVDAALKSFMNKEQAVNFRGRVLAKTNQRIGELT
jgi:hypothetical protein